jgi:hypothetical protein
MHHRGICGALRIRPCALFHERDASRKPEPDIVRQAQKSIAGLRSRLTPRDRQQAVTVIKTNEANLDCAVARALALAVEGELVQVVLIERTDGQRLQVDFGKDETALVHLWQVVEKVR